MTLCCARKILTATDGCWYAFFKEHPQAVLGAVFNSRIYQVASYLHEKGQKLAELVGYDLLHKKYRVPENR